MDDKSLSDNLDISTCPRA